MFHFLEVCVMTKSPRFTTGFWNYCSITEVLLEKHFVNMIKEQVIIKTDHSFKPMGKSRL